MITLESKVGVHREGDVGVDPDAVHSWRGVLPAAIDLVEVLAGHYQDFVVVLWEFAVDFGVVDDVVASHAEGDVGLGGVHGVVVIPEVSRSLEVLIPVDLCVDIGDSTVKQERGGDWIFEVAVVGIVQDCGETHPNLSVFAQPRQWVPIERRPNLQSMDVTHHRDVIGRDPEGTGKSVGREKVCGVQVRAILVPWFSFFNVAHWNVLIVEGAVVAVKAVDVTEVFTCRVYIINPCNFDRLVSFHIEDRPRETTQGLGVGAVPIAPVSHVAAVGKHA